MKRVMARDHMKTMRRFLVSIFVASIFSICLMTGCRRQTINSQEEIMEDKFHIVIDSQSIDRVELYWNYMVYYEQNQTYIGEIISLLNGEYERFENDAIMGTRSGDYLKLYNSAGELCHEFFLASCMDGDLSILVPKVSMKYKKSSVPQDLQKIVDIVLREH